ncbi:protein NUCLEAR FUSION DEFECTIVE 6, mitochondrial-like isoform X1 [Macadamia integrifolia]|uniref:protein NUCLEAR FUSION DEFECTIVE 6, mitochondrial-like isoform X1 n=1 Tax=Macadamia integrifolia TaxID=60698 RepID=UPI001C4E8F1A|nr:protein NUCLEAR FUSION DEFECTIVE 6, mitochondrial-like isoform X1 [Macadamia integrifolia]
MAANYARRTLLSSPASASKILSECRSSSSFVLGASKVGGFASTKPTSARVSQHKLSLFSGFPMELGCAQSLMPLHSVTASALLTSMLFLKGGNWGWLSEGLATPL